MKSYLDEQMAAVVRLAMQCQDGAVYPYYWKIPEDFRYPAVYFPAPQVRGSLPALNIYRASYSWFIKFIAAETVDAHKMASTMHMKILQMGMKIPLYDFANGSQLQKSFRVKDIEIKDISEGIVQMHLTWDRYRGCEQETGMPSTGIVLEGLYASEETADTLLAAYHRLAAGFRKEGNT